MKTGRLWRKTAFFIWNGKFFFQASFWDFLLGSSIFRLNFLPNSSKLCLLALPIASSLTYEAKVIWHRPYLTNHIEVHMVEDSFNQNVWAKFLDDGPIKLYNPSNPYDDDDDIKHWIEKSFERPLSCRDRAWIFKWSQTSPNNRRTSFIFLVQPFLIQPEDKFSQVYVLTCFQWNFCYLRGNQSFLSHMNKWTILCDISITRGSKSLNIFTVTPSEKEAFTNYSSTRSFHSRRNIPGHNIPWCPVMTGLTLNRGRCLTYLGYAAQLHLSGRASVHQWPV